MTEVDAQPTEQHAREIVRQALGEEPISTCRFPTGLCHHVYDVVTASKRKVVVRIAQPSNHAYLEGAVYWSSLLRPKGVRLPEIIHYCLDDARTRFPYMILERLDGTDLGCVYPNLSRREKAAIVADVVNAQRIVAALPEGDRFGHAAAYDTIPYNTWSAMIEASLARSESWISAAGVVDPAIAERVRSAANSFAHYFESVRPIPFLDDTTTKNVIVHDGRFSGIVDVDEVCFGDALLTPALTQMSLLSSGYSTDYVDLWSDALNLDDQRRSVLRFYTAMFCVCFLGELGQRFNSPRPKEVDHQVVMQLTRILDDLLASL
jgi:aminoglycoside phosphotransferase